VNSKAPSTRVFFDTSDLSWNGAVVSSEWVTLGKAQKDEERFQQIEAWISRVRTQWSLGPQPSNALRPPKREAVLTEKTAQKAIFTYAHPSGNSWTFEFRRRGIEWLLGQITMTP